MEEGNITDDEDDREDRCMRMNDGADCPYMYELMPLSVRPGPCSPMDKSTTCSTRPSIGDSAKINCLDAESDTEVFLAD
jgi:hypothetical protein